MCIIRGATKTIVEVETVVYRADGTIKDRETDRIVVGEEEDEKT